MSESPADSNPPVDAQRPTLSVRRTRVSSIIDAGDAVSVANTIERLADDRLEALMCAYTWTSRLRPDMGLADERIRGLPTDETCAELGWTSLRFPLVTPEPVADGMFYLVIDLKRQSYGRLALHIEVTEDILLEVGYAARRSLQGQVLPAQADRLTLPPGIHEKLLPDAHSARYILIHISAAATIHDLSWEESSYPYPLERRLETSDPALAAIWRTAELTMRHGGTSELTDHPNLNAGFSLFGDLDRLRWQQRDWLDMLAAEEDDDALPASALEPMRVIDAVYYIWRSADQELAPEILRGCLRVLFRCHELQVDGLCGGRGDDYWLSACTRDSLRLVQAYYAAAWLQTFLGDDDSGFLTSNAGVALIGSMRAQLWDQQRGAYSVGLDQAGDRVPYCGQADNALAVTIPAMNPYEMERAHEFCAGESGIWPTNRSGWQGADPRGFGAGAPEEPIVAATPAHLLDCARAMAQLESPRTAIDFIRMHFGAMVDEGGGAYWGVVSDPRQASAAHGALDPAAATVADVIMEIALGVTITAAGGVILDWRPWQVRVERLRGKIRTIHGDVLLGWHGDELMWTVPEGVRVELTAPDNSRHIITGPRTSFPKDEDEIMPPDEDPSVEDIEAAAERADLPDTPPESAREPEPQPDPEPATDATEDDDDIGGLTPGSVDAVALDPAVQEALRHAAQTQVVSGEKGNARLPADDQPTHAPTVKMVRRRPPETDEG